jgi:hypothetical protein
MHINGKCIGSLPCQPWNKGKLIAQKPPLPPKHAWAIRTRLQRPKAHEKTSRRCHLLHYGFR